MKKRSAIRQYQITLVIFLLVLFLLSYSFFSIRAKQAYTQNLKSEQEELFESYDNKISSLEYELAKQNSPLEQDTVLRNTYPVQLPGEKLVVLLEEEPKKEIKKATVEEKSFWQKLFGK